MWFPQSDTTVLNRMAKGGNVQTRLYLTWPEFLHQDGGLTLVRASMGPPTNQRDLYLVWTCPQILRQLVKAQIPLNGELSHGIVAKAVHQGV